MADVVARLSGPLRRGSDTAATVVVVPGGSAANTAAWLADLGVATTLVGAVGDDAFGRRQLDDLQARGVETVVAVVPGAATGTVVALVDAAGERTFVTDRGANTALDPTSVPLDPDGHLHVSGYALLDPATSAAARQVLAAGRAASMTVSVDTGSAEPLRNAGPTAWREWTSGADLCFANLMEGRVITGCRQPAAVAAALAVDYREVVLKLGAAGCRWAAGPEQIALPAHPPVALVDTVGAGDAFAAGYLAAWRRRDPPAAALAWAAETAARAVAVAGGRPPPARDA
jgi:ribokinase